MLKTGFKMRFAGLALVATTLAVTGCGPSPIAPSLANRYQWSPEESMLSWSGVKALSREVAMATFVDTIKAFSGKGQFRVQHHTDNLANPLSNIAVSWGDPHFSTYDMGKKKPSNQFYFDNLDEGYVLLTNSMAPLAGRELQVQARQKRLSEQYVANKAAAVRAGSHKVVIDLEAPDPNKFRVDGVARSIPELTSPISLSGDVMIRRVDTYTIVVELGTALNSDAIYLQAFETGFAGLALNVGVLPNVNRVRGDLVGGLGSDDMDSDLFTDFRDRQGREIGMGDLNKDGTVTHEEKDRINDAIDGKVTLTPQEDAAIKEKINTHNTTWRSTFTEIFGLWF